MVLLRKNYLAAEEDKSTYMYRDKVLFRQKVTRDSCYYPTDILFWRNMRGSVKKTYPQMSPSEEMEQ